MWGTPWGQCRGSKSKGLEEECSPHRSAPGAKAERKRETGPGGTEGTCCPSTFLKMYLQILQKKIKNQVKGKDKMNRERATSKGTSKACN